MAARRDGEERLWPDGVRFERAQAELCAWFRPDDLLVGHNLHRFDRPAIAERAPTSPLLQLATVDSLELSTVAFPRRPYHRLAKDDLLVRDATPNPVSDVRASEQVLLDAVAALHAVPDRDRGLLAALFARADVPVHARRGFAALFQLLGWRWDPLAPVDLVTAWGDRVCRNTPWLQHPTFDLELLMVAAWLRVAHHLDGSVLPAWVRRAMPRTRKLLHDLRATSCTDPGCSWCVRHASPEHWLAEVFGFDGFRAEPAAPDGSSLQRLLVDRGIRGEPTFGILPTGGGKSLCFQVPAEARHRRLGQLTVVISPLQSLMKDQVDALSLRIPHARALYSGLPTVLRPQILDEVVTGACGLLYLSPEQFRNRSILNLLAKRDLGAIVFDEAHCLSQWGHDFRTDYPYVLKAVRRLCDRAGQPMPPVFLFTATTQHDATEQIRGHVREHTAQEVLLVDGGSARTNLSYQVQEVPEASRHEVVARLIAERVGEDGAAIVFCGTRATTEEAASALSDLGHAAVAYHAGLDPDERRTLQEQFLSGQCRVIAATNAFGMGVDKANVRLVVHLQMPSSLESYLQEAGRAGRDGAPASAVLLWSPGDAEARFSLGASAALAEEDLGALWKAIEQLPSARRPHDQRSIRTVTPKELLFQEALAGRFDPTEPADETRVKAGVNWLEIARVLERTENQTRVFSGRPQLPTLAESLARVDALDLPPHRATAWKLVIGAVFKAGEAGLAADDIAVLSREMSEADPMEGGLRVLKILNQMVDARLLSAGQTFTAFVSKGVADSSHKRLERWADRERLVADELAEAQTEARMPVHLRSMSDRLTRPDAACTPNEVAILLGTWGTAGQGHSTNPMRPRFFHHRNDVGFLELDGTASRLGELLETRRAVATRALEVLLDRADGKGKQLVVGANFEDLVASVDSDPFLKDRLTGVTDAVRSAVAWLHDLKIVTVANGLAVFRSALTLERDDTWPKLGKDQARSAAVALEAHEAHKVLCVHVMDTWARTMLTAPDRAERLRADWFRLPIAEFKKRWFPRKTDAIQRPTTQESYDAIVTELGDKDQQRIVTADLRRNHLVLAGPGSGKTRILVHRLAWLLRCHRVRPRQILVVCYTRANALELRRRLEALVGRDARHVTIQTLHGVALSMVGAARIGPGGDLTLETCIAEAAAMLRGEKLDSGEQSRQRDRLLRGFEYVFIDEYQDIDARSYELLSAMTGRTAQGDQRRLRVFAVGDDDQAIFGFDGGDASFIRSFPSDYHATEHVLVNNYRNPHAVLDLAQRFIGRVDGRMKHGHTLVVNASRRHEPPMGPWGDAHAHLRGRIPWHRAASVRAAAHHLMTTVRAWLDDGVEPDRIGVLTRTRPEGLHRLRLAAESLRVPFSWPLPREKSVPVTRIREVVRVFEHLAQLEERVPGVTIREFIDELGGGPWVAALHGWLEPNIGRHWLREQWRYDLFAWAQLERRARTIGDGVHLGTKHSAKGLEFDHVLLLDDGTMTCEDEDRRLLYVALTRARRSLQLWSSFEPSAAYRELVHPALEVREVPMLAAEPAGDREYGLLGGGDLWIDWLGRKDPGHEGHAALREARYGDTFQLRLEGDFAMLVDASGRRAAALSKAGKEAWLPRLAHGLRLRLLAVTSERTDGAQRTEDFKDKLQVDRWWTGVWEARWLGDDRVRGADGS